MSSSRLEGPELAALLARKAQEDATAVREFAANPEIADGIIGFHSQQAVEKWLKAVMAARGLREARIHDIGRLIQLLEKDGAELPEVADQLDELTIYAVPLRYDELLDAEPLDREATVALVEEVGRWADAEVEPPITPIAELDAERGTKPASAEDFERLSGDVPSDDEG